MKSIYSEYVFKLNCIMIMKKTAGLHICTADKNAD